MGRIARVVAPGFPHHITQRGNRRQRTFFADQDYVDYKTLMAEWCSRWSVQIWSYCLMPNHVHLIAVPETSEGLGRAIGEAHRRYTRMVNFREGWRGFLWQGRFASFPMDEMYLLAAVRYVELNPVRAGLAGRPEDYRWSSAAAHINGNIDSLLDDSPLNDMVGDWRGFLDSGDAREDAEHIRRHERTGRPLGGDGFIRKMEGLVSRSLGRKKPGPKRDKGDN